jgi:hypothetical protein
LREPLGGPQDVLDLFIRMVCLDPERAGRIVVSFGRRRREHWPAFIASLNGPRPPDRRPLPPRVAVNDPAYGAMDWTTEQLESVSRGSFASARGPGLTRPGLARSALSQRDMTGSVETLTPPDVDTLAIVSPFVLRGSRKLRARRHAFPSLDHAQNTLWRAVSPFIGAARAYAPP